MEYLIIPEDRVEKLRQMEFDKLNYLDPIQGELDGKKVYFLQAELRTNKIFVKALTDFEASEVKDIEKIEDKFYDAKGQEITDLTNVELSLCTCKTILTAKK